MRIKSATINDENEKLIVCLPSGESLEIDWDGVDPVVWLVDFSGETRTILIPKG